MPAWLDQVLGDPPAKPSLPPWLLQALTPVADATAVKARPQLPQPTIGPLLERNRNAKPARAELPDYIEPTGSLLDWRPAYNLLNAPNTAADLTPGLSEARGIAQGVKLAAGGNPALGAALAAVPIVTGVKMPEGAVVEEAARSGKRAASNTGKAALANVDFRSVSPEEALAMARRGEHLRQLPNGQYVGAPAGTNSPSKLGALRRNFDALVEGGEHGLDWYPRARAAVEEMAGPDAARQSQVARSLGNFSSQANPDVNLGFHLQAEEAYNAGVPRTQVRTGIQGRKYNTARDTGEPLKLGPKQEPYVNKFDPTQDPNHIPTNDIWHGRSWGFVNPDGSPWSSGFSPSQHTWLDGETILAADRANRKQLLGQTGWNSSNVQAAPWVYLKGLSLHEKYPKRFPTLADGVAEAAKSYGENFPKYTVFATHESVPGAGTGHLPGLLGAPFAERQAYDKVAPWADANGRDVLYDALGTSQRKMNDATGYFTPEGGTPEINPAHASRPLFGVAKDAGGSTLSPVAQSTLNKVEGLRAYLDAQNMGAWHKLEPDAKAAVSTSVRIPLERPLTESEMKHLAPIAEKHGFGISDTGDGVSLMNFGGGPADGKAVAKALRGELGQELNRIFPGSKAYRARLVSDAIDYQDAFSAANAGQGKATRQLLGLLDDQTTPAVAGKLSGSPAVRAKAAANAARDEGLTGQYGNVRPDIQAARRIFAEQGLEGLRKALKAGVALPVGLLGLGLFDHQGGE